ncbi:MAG: hypothetical protein JWN77_1120 [Frankiales bacterium]|nr:hypothetical protein [Frankiales bacterium]
MRVALPSRLRHWQRLRGRQVGLTYAAIVLPMTIALQMVSEPARTRLVLAVSTDPDRLLAHPVRSLLISPFVVPVWSGLLLLPLVVLVVGAVQRSLGALAAASAGVLGHVSVSVLIAVLLERDNDAPDTAGAADVGVSYVLAVSAGLALVQLRGRSAWAAALTGTTALAVPLAIGRTSTDAGHLAAWALGVAASLCLRTAATQRRSAAPQRL